jgi:PAS domain S-box-containing protein
MSFRSLSRVRWRADVPVLPGSASISFGAWSLVAGLLAIWLLAAGLSVRPGWQWVLLPASALVVLVAGTAVLVCDHRRRQVERTSALLFQIFQDLPIGIQVKDRSLRYVWANRTHAQRTRRHIADMLGRSVQEMGFDPALVAVVNEQDRRVLATGEPVGPEEQISRSADGNVAQVVLVTKFPLRWNGAISHIATVDVDTATWRDAQLRNEEVRRLLENVMQAAPLTIQVIDRESRVRWANQAFRAHFGWEAESPIGRPMTEVIRSDRLAPEMTALNAEIFAGRKGVTQVEQFYPPRHGLPPTWLLATKVPIVDAAGQVVQILTMATDVSALKRAQAAAQVANSLVEGILRTVPLGIQVKDADLRFRWVNQEFAGAVSRTPEDLVGLTLGDLDLPPASVALTHDRDRHVLTTGETLRFEEHWVRGTDRRVIMVIKAPILDAAGHPTHVITVGANITEIHHLRAEADAARRRLQHVLDAVPVTIALKDTQGRYQWVNRRFQQVADLPADRLIGRRSGELAGGSPFGTAIDEAEQRLLATGVPGPPMTQVLRTSDGSERHFSVTRVAMWDAGGKIDGILVVGVDVTDLTRITDRLRLLNEDLEQRVAERARELARVNELVSAVIQSSPVPIGIYDMDGTVLAWNPAAEQILGYTEAEARAGQMPIHRPEELAVVSHVAALIRRGQSFSNLPTIRQHKNGQTVELLASGAPLRRADGEIHGAVVILLDVTARNQAERALTAAREHLRDAIESVDHAIILYDRDDRVAVYNRHVLEQVPGLRDVLKLGTSFTTALRAAVARGISVVPDGQDPESFIAARIARHRKADGTRMLLPLSDGRTLEVWERYSGQGGIIQISVDVTERLLLERQLRQAQKMEAIGQLTGGIAHDFNNLLAIIVANLDSLALLAGHEAAAQEMIASSLTAAMSGAGLTQRLLAFASRQTLAPSVVSVNELVETMVALLRRSLGGNIVITLELDPALWPVFIDAPQLEASLLNLAVNARDAMPEGGSLTIATRNLDAAEALRFDGQLQPGDYVAISVTDNGTGMPPAVREHIFEPFFTTKERSRGTGLGLSQVFGFLRQSNGLVTVQTEVGRGSTFCLYLPRAQAEQAGKAAAEPVVSESGGGETILVVDDNESLRRSLVTMFTALGYQVLDAPDADGALALLESRPIRLVLTDVVMPGATDGIALARIVLRRWPNTRVIVTSGFAEASFRHGGDAVLSQVRFLHKPFRRPQLARVIREALAEPDRALPAGTPAVAADG